MIPVFLRLRQGEAFERGPWHLGRWSYLVGWIAVIWVVFISIYFMLPQFSPITYASFNYAPVAFGLLLLFVYGYWAVSARKWFKGPQIMGTPEELAALEAELEAVHAGRAPAAEFHAMEDAMEARPDERD